MGQNSLRVQAVELYTLHNKNGLTADISTFGATLVRLNVPDKNGNMGDVVLGWDSAGTVHVNP